MDGLQTLDQPLVSDEIADLLVDESYSIGAIDLTVSRTAKGDELVNVNFDFNYCPGSAPLVDIETFLSSHQPAGKRIVKISGVVSYGE